MPLPQFSVSTSTVAAVHEYLAQLPVLSHSVRVSFLIKNISALTNNIEERATLGITLLQTFASLSNRVSEFDVLMQRWRTALGEQEAARTAQHTSLISQLRQTMADRGAALARETATRMQQAKQLTESSGTPIPSDLVVDYALQLFHEGDAEKGCQTLTANQQAERQSLVMVTQSTGALSPEDVRQLVLAVAMSLVSTPAYGKGPTDALLKHAASLLPPAKGAAEPTPFWDQQRRSYDRYTLTAVANVFDVLVATSRRNARGPVMDAAATLLDRLSSLPVNAISIDRVAAVTELVDASELLWFAALSALGTLDRSATLELFGRPSVRGWLDDDVTLSAIVDSAIQCRFADALSVLETPQLRQTLDTNLFLGPLTATLIMRLRDTLLCQYVMPFSSLSIPNMAAAFRLDTDSLQDDLVRLIQEKRMPRARIDDVKRLLVVKQELVPMGKALHDVVTAARLMKEDSARCARWVSLRRGDLLSEYQQSMRTAPGMTAEDD